MFDVVALWTGLGSGDSRISYGYGAGPEHVIFSPNGQILLPPNSKSREVLGESQGRLAVLSTLVNVLDVRRRGGYGRGYSGRRTRVRNLQQDGPCRRKAKLEKWDSYSGLNVEFFWKWGRGETSIVITCVAFGEDRCGQQRWNGQRMPGLLMHKSSKI